MQMQYIKLIILINIQLRFIQILKIIAQYMYKSTNFFSDTTYNEILMREYDLLLVNLIICLRILCLYFFYIILYLKYYINFDIYFFNFDIFIYSCHVHVIFYIVFLFIYFCIVFESRLLIPYRKVYHFSSNTNIY